GSSRVQAVNGDATVMCVVVDAIVTEVTCRTVESCRISTPGWIWGTPIRRQSTRRPDVEQQQGTDVPGRRCGGRRGNVLGRAARRTLALAAGVLMVAGAAVACADESTT